MTAMTEHHTATFAKIREDAIAASRMGLAVLPLYAYDEGMPEHTRGKRPRMMGWQNTKLTPEQVTDWWNRHPRSNVGVVCGKASGLICLDIDPRGGGMEWASSHKAELDAISAAREVSGRGDGGFHIWLLHPGDREVRSGKLAPGVDFKADGGQQVVTAPSIHALTGECYRWEGACASLAEVPLVAAEIPEWLLALADAMPAIKERRPIKAGELTNDPFDQESYRAWLSSQPQVARFQGANNALYRMAGAGRDYGLSMDTVVELLVEWNTNPEIPESEIRPIVRNLYRYGKEEPGAKSVVAFARAPVVIPEEDPFADPPEPEEVEESLAELIGASWHDDLKWKNVVNKETTPPTTIRICPLPTLNNAVVTLTHHQGTRGAFAFNEFTRSVDIVRPVPWSKAAVPRACTDADLLECRAWLERLEEVGVAYEKGVVADAVDLTAHRKKHHPVRSYLEGLTWDGMPRLESWLNRVYNIDDTPLTRAYACRTLIAAVARVMDPGCQVDTVLILEGEQGFFKTQGLKVLAAPWVKELHGDITSKDFLLALRGAWIVELGELSSFNKTEVNHLKALISCRTDTIRDPYARLTAEVPRQCIWVGTTNADHYLSDPTGHRRYWPARVRQKGDIDWLRKNRDQLWAEAKHRHASGEQWWLTEEEQSDSASSTEDRVVEDPLIDTVRRAVDGDEMNPRVNSISMSDLMARCGMVGVRAGVGEARRIGACLRQLGWVRKNNGAPGHRAKLWWRT